MPVTWIQPAMLKDYDGSRHAQNACACRSHPLQVHIKTLCCKDMTSEVHVSSVDKLQPRAQHLLTQYHLLLDLSMRIVAGSVFSADSAIQGAPVKPPWLASLHPPSLHLCTYVLSEEASVLADMCIRGPGASPQCRCLVWGRRGQGWPRLNATLDCRVHQGWPLDSSCKAATQPC